MSSGATARAFALAIPLVLVFGSLFVAADAVFEGLVRDAVDLGALPSHALIALGWAWLAAGLLRFALGPTERRALEPARRLGRIEVAVALGALDALFLAFVLVQLRYLFGGQEHVVATAGLTYAEYARRGFFELVAVAALVVPLLLAGDALVHHAARRIFRALALVLLALLAVVMASALERMRLYTAEYGLTELRLYTTGFMAWLGLLAAWSLVTVFRERRVWFAPGAAAAAFGIVLALNVVNPDALIARTNLDRHLTRRKELDVLYLGDLSADAAPTIARRLDVLAAGDRRYLEQRLARFDAPGDWRTSNWSRRRARGYASSARAANR